jgi:hypothetical protein
MRKMHAQFCCKFHGKQEETMKGSINQLVDILAFIKSRVTQLVQ